MLQPQAPKNSLNDIIAYFAQFAHLYQNAPWRIHDDLLIETAVGCFRIGYTKDRQCTALFYARHPDDLAVIDNDGRLEFLHKDYVYLVGTHKIHKAVEAHNGGKLQFDNGWIKPLIEQVIYSLPRTLLREASLFRLGDDHFSEYVTYQPVAAGINGAVGINIFINPYMTYDWAVIEPALPEGAEGKLRAFRQAAQKNFRRVTSSRFPLHVKKEIEGEKPQRIEFFEKQDISRIILPDFDRRTALTWSGRLPVAFQEKHMLPLFHASANLRLEFERLTQHLKSFENVARFGANYGTLGILNVFFHIVGYNMLVRRITEYGRVPVHPRIRPEIYPMVRKHLRRLTTLHSDLNGLLLKPDSSTFGDFEAIHAEKHECSFIPEQAQFVARDPRREFGSWLKRHFFASYAAAWKLYGPFSSIKDTDDFHDAAALQQEVSNGLKIFVLPQSKEREMYVYFHDDGYRMKRRNLPHGADQYLKAGKVLRLSLNDMSDSFSEIDFSVFEKRIRGLIKATSLQLPAAETPNHDRINDLPLLHARGESRVFGLAAGAMPFAP